MAPSRQSRHMCRNRRQTRQPLPGPSQAACSGTGKSSSFRTARAWMGKIRRRGVPWKRARLFVKRRYSPGPSTGTGRPSRLCQALIALTLCFSTGSVVSKANASQMKARTRSVLIGSKSPSTPFQTAHVSTVSRCVAYLRRVLCPRSMGSTCRSNAAADSATDGTF